MKLPLFALFFFAVIFNLSAQSSDLLALANPDNEPAAAPIADRFMPALATGDLLTFLYEKLDYPAIAVENGAEGTVVIALNIGQDGLVKATNIIRSVPLLDDAALEAVAQLPRLLPAVENGKAIERKLYIPIRFRLQ